MMDSWTYNGERVGEGGKEGGRDRGRKRWRESGWRSERGIEIRGEDR